MESYWGKTVKEKKKKYDKHYVSILLINSGDLPMGCPLFRYLDYGRRLTQEKQSKFSREADTIVTQLIQGPVTTGLGANPDKQQGGLVE